MKNLIVVRAGDDSLHRSWLGPAKAYDLLVSYYGSRPGRFSDTCESYIEEPGLKWPAMHRLWETRRDLLSQYDCVVLADDDLQCPATAWSEAFRIFHDYGLDLAQPAVTGHVSHGITAPHQGTVLRYTNFAEIMVPMFSRRSLSSCAATFGLNKSGYGLDWLWGDMLVKRGWKVGIIDQASVEHTRPPLSGLFRKCLELGIDPNAECGAVLGSFSIAPVYRTFDAVKCGEERLVVSA